MAADISSGGTKTAMVSDHSGISTNHTLVFRQRTIGGRIGYAADIRVLRDGGRKLGYFCSRVLRWDDATDFVVGCAFTSARKKS